MYTEVCVSVCEWMYVLHVYDLPGYAFRFLCQVCSKHYGCEQKCLTKKKKEIHINTYFSNIEIKTR